MRKIVFACALILAARIAGADSKTPPLWGSLQPGSYRIGFRTRFLLDASRSWKNTRPFGKSFSPDRIGRPIRLDVWYPAAATDRRTMRMKDYLDTNTAAPPQFDELRKILADRDRLIIGLDVPAAATGAFLQSPMNATRNAPEAPGAFPLVLYFSGLNDAATLNATVLAEFLSSHGYIVASVALIGSQADEPSQSRTPADIESAVRDMEFAWSVLRNERSVDFRRLATMGESVGGIEAVLLAMRNRNVTAVIGLDGTYHFAGATHVLTDFYSFIPRTFAAAVMDVRRSASTDIDLSAIKALLHSDRLLVALPRMHHSDFTAFAMFAEQFHLGNSPGYVDDSGWTRRTGFEGYQAMCRIVLADLEANLRNAPAAQKDLESEVERIGGTFERLPAVPLPPSMSDLAAVMAQHGFDAGTSLVEKFQKIDPTEEIVNERICNALGYDEVAHKAFANAIDVFRLCAATHPSSANAQDSLGDGYLADGQTQRASEAYLRAAALANDDPAIRPEDKRAFVEAENAKARHTR